MAYETGVATSIADLFDKLSTFATANVWTEDHSDVDRLFLTKSTCSVAFRWSTTSPTLAAIYQHTAFISGATDPGNHTNDSGNGIISGVNATLATGRHVPLLNSNMRYWFFEDDTYVYVTAEVGGVGSLNFRHFGFGILEKVGTWTGGAFAFGQRDDAAPGAGDAAIQEDTCAFLDGLAGTSTPTTMRAHAATIHIESLPNQTASGKWGITWAGGLANTGTDRGSTARENLQGGFRAGPIAKEFGRFGGVAASGLVPGYPIGAWYDDRALARWYLLGYMPNIRGFNVKNYAGGEEIVIGSDTWVAFPTRYKSTVSATGTSRNQGVLFKVTA